MRFTERKKEIEKKKEVQMRSCECAGGVRRVCVCERVTEEEEKNKEKKQ